MRSPAWSAQGKASAAVITQNVDNLHQESGVPASQVIELHGNASYATCLDCGLRHELADLRAGLVDGAARICPPAGTCGGVVKSATISFGQSMPEEPMLRAEEESLACDLFLVLGSSLVVYPAAAFPPMAKRNGATRLGDRQPRPDRAGRHRGPGDPAMSSARPWLR